MILIKSIFKKLMSKNDFHDIHVLSSTNNLIFNLQSNVSLFKLKIFR